MEIEMELQVGESYIAYKGDNPLKNFKFKVDHLEDLFFEGTIEEGITHVDLWKPYIVRLSTPENISYLEIAPYAIFEKTKKAKFIILGHLFERRKFLRFNVLQYGIRIESKYFEGIVENVSLGGLKIKLHLKKGEIPKAPIWVKTTVEGKEFEFLITPVHIDEDFISAKFEKPAKVTSEFFYHCLKILQRETMPVSEKRRFRRFYVEPLNIIVDTPLGVGIMFDISLGGMRIRLKREYKAEDEVLKGRFDISCYIPQTKEEFILESELVNKSREGFLQLKIPRWNEDGLKLISRILELLVESKKV